MTSFAFIAGLIPLCIAAGAGAMGNRSIGTAAAGGMLIGTIFGVLVIPTLSGLSSGIWKVEYLMRTTRIFGWLDTNAAICSPATCDGWT
jgi:hypothetical protein